MWSFFMSILFVIWGLMLIKVKKEGLVNNISDWIAWITGWVFDIAFIIVIYILNHQHL